MCAASMAFIEDSGTAKKYRQAIKQENFLRHWLLQTPGEEIAKRRRKMIFPLR
jgi:hypothetical protein